MEVLKEEEDSRRYSNSPEPDQSAFKTRMMHFQYSGAADTPSPRRSSRIPSRPSPNNTPSPSSSAQKKRPLPTDSLLHGTDELDETSDLDSPATKGGAAPPKLKKRRSTTKERSAKDPYSPANNLVDSLRPGLTLVCIGLNPGLMTAATGHAYAHPSNRFWHLLHDSGVTPKKHIPAETRDLMDLYQIGNTNTCERPTRSGDGLSKQELEEGAVVLEKKIATFRPEAVVIVGKGIWESLWIVKKGQKRFNDPNFHWGWQDEDMQIGRTMDAEGQVVWSGARTFVATSTSGLAATLRPAEKLAIWKPLGDWMALKRKETRASKLVSSD
ncbi:uracil DNA N-glycosylase Thp1 [Exophiala xenobiotica]|nr:uracil DNA N-glycosylase Thp1 [Exophiala xenobiotica]KAK5356510.1 uracil DNA N-glycosylase Thp1 [Exophiala xenobiotica]KAK5370981.1 uracil DNA N-glycosylase Thp1 [Exophiala xenobiotica]KAK5389667.1 uracil DNA N-glycosylase Thp1 [Exophiala xenobiotica]